MVTVPPPSPLTNWNRSGDSIALAAALADGDGSKITFVEALADGRAEGVPHAAARTAKTATLNNHLLADDCTSTSINAPGRPWRRSLRRHCQRSVTRSSVGDAGFEGAGPNCPGPRGLVDRVRPPQVRTTPGKRVRRPERAS